MTLGTRRLQLALQRPLATTEKLQFESNRAQRACESPPPHAARATFTAFIPLDRWRRLAPLAEPAAPHLKKKFGLAPTPLEAKQNPGWSAQRHRKGRRPEGRNYPRPKLDLMLSPSYCRLVETGGRRHPRRRDATFATLTRAAAGVSRETAPSLPLLRPRSPSARLGKSYPINSSFIGLISSLRRGARDFSLHFVTQTQQKPRRGRSAREDWFFSAKFGPFRRGLAKGVPTPLDARSALVVFVFWGGLLSAA